MKRTASGQILLVAAMLLLVLVITIPAIILFNKKSTEHGVNSLLKTKGRGVANEGVSFAIQQLSTATAVAAPAQNTGIPGPGSHADGDAASFQSQSVMPTVMFQEQVASVSITYRNMATTPWTAGAYALRSVQGDEWDNPPRASSIVPLVAGGTVLPDATTTFFFLVRAPDTLGTYEFQWGMSHETASPRHSFSPNSPNVTISVQPMAATPLRWPYFPGGILPSAGTVNTGQGTNFVISYTSFPANNLKNYQVGIISRPLDKTGKVISGSSVYSVVSHKTVGVKLTNGMSASAAIQLTNNPPAYIGDGQVTAVWGPIASFGETEYRLSSFPDTTQSPRKFAVGGISPCTTSPGCPSGRPYSPPLANLPPTDQREYWAHTDLGLPAPIDLAYYLKQAQSVTTVSFTDTAWPSNWECEGTCQHYSNSGYFAIAPGSKLIIGKDGSDWTYSTADAVLYFDGGGTVEFRNVAIDLKNTSDAPDTGAIIAAGNLEIGLREGNRGLTVTSIPVPVTAPLEYPYSTGNNWPCAGLQGQNCNLASLSSGDNRISIRSFIYVVGNMIVHRHETGHAPSPPPYHMTNLAGTLQVDGQLTVDHQHAWLQVMLDSEINHAIRTTNFEIQVDSATAIP